jgi:hypothetical protein
MCFGAPCRESADLDAAELMPRCVFVLLDLPGDVGRRAARHDDQEQGTH